MKRVMQRENAVRSLKYVQSVHKIGGGGILLALSKNCFFNPQNTVNLTKNITTKLHIATTTE